MNMLRTRIKICGITREQDLDDAVAAGADAIGMVFYPPSPRYVTPAVAARLVRRLPPFVTPVGLFVDADPVEVRQVVEAVGLQLLQFHGDESPGTCEQARMPYMKALRVRPGVDLLEYAACYSSAQALLVDAYVDGVPGGTGQMFDWALLPPSLPLPLVLSGGLTVGNVRQAIQQVQPYAVDVSSGVEHSRGIKDAARMAAFVQEVRHAIV